jgi:two-component system, OmpR family, phosphate regulon sensor histidine kinase PhoR
MSIQSPKKLAFGLSGLITLFFSGAVAILNFFLLKEQWWILGALALTLFVFSYILIRFYLNNFLYNRIKLIYKTIRQHKIPKGSGDLRKKVNNPDFIDEVEGEVLVWAQAKSLEVETLKKQEKFRREFIGNISHELKTPIFNIQGYILTLLDGGLEDETINKEYLKRTEISVNRMIAIINDLETISKLESGDQKLNITKFDIHSLAHDVIDFYEIVAREKNIRLVINSSTDHAQTVKADRDQIRQVLNNLIENSIKYGKSGGRTKISFFDMDEHVLIEVTDDGIGIGEEELSRVFERFYRTNRGRSADHGGSGLGLAIVKHIVEAHGQTINVRSTIGIGTTFAFTLKKA